MKTILVFMMIGAIVGAVGASFIVPPYLSWYASPGSITPEKHVESLCNLPEMIRYTSSWLLRGQLIGAGIGALLFLYPGIAAARRRGAAAPPAAAA